MTASDAPQKKPVANANVTYVDISLRTRLTITCASAAAGGRILFYVTQGPEVRFDDAVSFYGRGPFAFRHRLLPRVELAAH